MNLHSPVGWRAHFANIFYNIRKTIFPIQRNELARFISIAMMMFCVLFVQNMIRAIKDSIVNTMIGVQSVAFLKLYGVIPASILFTAFYIKMVSKINGASIFYIVLSSFTIFFFVFGFVIFPNHTWFHFNTDTTLILVEKFIHLKWFIMLASTWSFGLFYIVAELWPTLVFGLLCWQFINSITTVEQSKRFYLMFGLVTQTGMFLCGKILTHSSAITDFIKDLCGSTNSRDVLFVQTILGLSCFFCIGAMLFFRYINKHILTKDNKLEMQQIQLKSKTKRGLRESLRYIFTSPYILLITTMLLCYGLSVNLVEAPWKAMVVKRYPSPAEYGAFVGRYLSASGVLTIVFVLIGSTVIRRLGWIAGALFTPIAMFITGIMFFLSNKFSTGNHNSMGIYFAAQDQIMLMIYWGMQHNIVTKASKYTLFDSTKEMAYVPLDPEMKTKGKAAADMVGSKLGKSLSSFLQASIFIIFPQLEYEDMINYIIVIFTLVCIVWFYAVVSLNRKYLKLTKEN